RLDRRIRSGDQDRDLVVAFEARRVQREASPAAMPVLHGDADATLVVRRARLRVPDDGGLDVDRGAEGEQGDVAVALEDGRTQRQAADGAAVVLDADAASTRPIRARQ